MIVKESIENFERGQDPKDAMGTGLWKDRDEIVIPIQEFKEYGGILTKGREIYARSEYHNIVLKGYWLDYDNNQEIDLMYNDRFKSTHVPPGAGIKVKCKVMYK